MKRLDIKSIPKYTSDGNYTVDIPLDYLPEKIENYIKRYALNMNPDFQRGHVWTEEQQIAFVEFVLRGGKTQPIRFNHYSWGTFRNNPEVDEMVCVDGLQRTTALLKFQNDELEVFGGYKRSQIDNLNLSNDIQITVNNLKTRKEVLQWYIDLNAGGTVHTEDDIEKVKILLNNEK